MNFSWMCLPIAWLIIITVGGVRPFGVSVLAAGYDKENGPELYQIDPSGAAFGWKATAIGKNYVNAKNFLERRYNEVRKNNENDELK